MDKEFYTWRGIQFKVVGDAPGRGCNDCAFEKVPNIESDRHPCDGWEQEAQIGRACHAGLGHHYEAP